MFLPQNFSLRILIIRFLTSVAYCSTTAVRKKRQFSVEAQFLILLPISSTGHALGSTYVGLTATAAVRQPTLRTVSSVNFLIFREKTKLNFSRPTFFTLFEPQSRFGDKWTLIPSHLFRKRGFDLRIYFRFRNGFGR